MMKESILAIAESIDERARDEQRNGYTNKAIARCHVSVQGTIYNPLDGENILFLTNNERKYGHEVKDWTGTSSHWQSDKPNTSSVGRAVYKNTRLGEILSKYWQGSHNYSALTYIKRRNELTVNILNKATYNPVGFDVRDIEIRFAGSNDSYKYSLLRALLDSNAEQQKKLEAEKERIRLLQEEKKRREEEERIAREKAKQAELERLEQERIQHEKEEAERQAEIKRIEQAMEETNRKINTIKNFLRIGVELRSQHLLDEFQEDAKRSHLYDGTAVVIEGGPGTGKTTTTIQRLKFLLSRPALEEYENLLSKDQINYLTDYQEWNNRWIFFSPTDLLLQYLRNNMAQEELIADQNTKTLDRYRNVKMRDYDLFNPTKDGPFKNFKSNPNDRLILKPKDAIESFEKFCIEFITKAMDKRVALKTSEYSWDKLAISIKATYRNMKVTSMDSLMRLINALSDRDKQAIKEIDSELRQLQKNEAYKVTRAVMSDASAVEQINALFEQWKREKLQLSDDDENDVTTSEEEEENTELESFNKQDFESQLFSTLRKLLRKLGLLEYDSKTKLSKRDQNFLFLVNDYIDDSIDIQTIGELAMFNKNFASMCRGLESCLINQLPKIYKAYRKDILDKKSAIYNCELLEAIIKKDNNKHLHIDEQNLLLGYMKNLFFNIYKKSKNRFYELKNRYVLAYKESVRPVIGIDEATDYSLLDYYLMVSFRYYEFSSVTLCGDIMQGLNSNGIDNWSDLKDFVLPDLDIKSLNISYRQLPSLVEISKEMYKDDQGTYPAYNSEHKISEDEPKPLLLVSDDDEEKAIWISNRIVDIYQTYGSLPSVAIFVGDDINIKEFIERIDELDMLNGIEIVDCSGGKKLDSKEVVRVFRLSEVKGMEFEAVFFYDIDKAIEGHSAKIMRRHLYVGVSRATSHLAATMTSSVGNESIIKYFDNSTDSWI